MTVIGTGAHPKALRPGVRAFVMGEYAAHPAMFSKVFEVGSSDMAYEEDVEITGFALPTIKTEGASISYQGHSQGFTKRYTHVAYSSGYIVTREEIRDNLYKARAFRRGKMLTFAFTTAKEIVHFNVLNRAFDSNYVGGDGKELIATDHPTLSGNQSNELATPADLSEASLEDVLTMIRLAKNSRGLPINIMPKRLIVSAYDAYNANRILNSDLQSGTGNNDVNAIKGLIPGGAMDVPFLTDSDAWFVQTNAPNGLLSFTRDAFEFDSDNDFDTKNAKFSGYERYSCGWTEWRSTYGVAGA